MHLRAFGYFAEHVCFSAAVGHTVQFLDGYGIGAGIIYHIGHTLEILYVIHAVGIFDIVSH